jgi:hypothetical protein
LALLPGVRTYHNLVGKYDTLYQAHNTNPPRNAGKLIEAEDGACRLTLALTPLQSSRGRQA